ncbi:MAG: hypothetical protein KBC96_11385 [Armatimonadetes bacterium]|nr:hypothetical protein [Armatimonadota bacterium]
MYYRKLIRRFTTIGAICLISLLSWSMSLAATPEETIELAKAGTKNAVSVIQNGKGKITQSVTRQRQDGSIAETEAVADMAFRGDKLRINELLTDPTNVVPAAATEEGAKKTYPTDHKAVSFDGEKLTYFEARTRFPRAQVGTVEGSGGIIKNYYHRKKLDYGVLENHGVWDIYCGAPSFPQVDGGLRFVGNETIDGRDCIVVERTILTMSKECDPVPVRSTILEWSIDTGKGFTIPRYRLWVGDKDGNKTILAEERNNEVRDYGNGVWGPSKSVVVGYAIDEQGERYEDTRIVTEYASDFVLNGNVTDSDLTVKLPAKTRVWNSITGESYQAP